MTARRRATMAGLIRAIILLGTIELLVGCGIGRPVMGSPIWRTGESTKSVELFSEIEREGAKYGFISVGAIRVAPYDLSGLNDLRQKQLQSLDALTKDI